jgi:hypothetical protein
MRALAKRSADRPTARAMIDVLESYARGTSAAAREQRSAEDRVREMAATRRERVLPKAEPPPRGASDPPAAQASIGLLGFAPERARRLGDGLSAQGLAAREWREDASPPDVIVLSYDKRTEGTLRMLRAGVARTVPILVVHVPSTLETPGLVRAGASDVALASVSDDVVSAKALRLVRRRR